MVLLLLTGEILAPAMSKTVSQTHFFTPNSCFIFKNLWVHIRLNVATLTGTVAKSFTLNKLSKATIQIFTLSRAKILVHALNISCLDNYIGLLDRFPTSYHCCFKVKWTKLYSLFLPFLSSQEDDEFIFLPHHIRKLYPWWGINPVFLIELWFYEETGTDSVSLQITIDNVAALASEVPYLLHSDERWGYPAFIDLVETERSNIQLGCIHSFILDIFKLTVPAKLTI